MNKKLLALAIAGALAAPLAAQADVSVYGRAHLSFDAIDGTEDAAGYGVTSRASRVGVKAAEDLGGGMKAVAQMEWGVNMSDAAGSAGACTVTQTAGRVTPADLDNTFSASCGNGNLTSRNQIVGLAGGFGTVAMGRHDTPLKMSTGKLDPFSDQLGDYNAVVGQDLRLDNVVAYLSPNFNGFNLNAAIVTDEAMGRGTDPAATSIALTYGNGPLYVSGAIETLADSEAADDGWTNTRVGVGYSIAGFDLGFVYQTIANGEDAGDNTPTSMYLSAAYKMGAATLKAGFGTRDVDVDDVDDSTLMAIGVDYALSKATTVYAQYASIDNDDAGTQALVDAYTGVDEGDQTGLSLGIAYSF